jgi:hypothetical protein
VILERIKLLLASHGSDGYATPFVAEKGELILEKGSIAKKNLLVNERAVAVEFVGPKGNHTPWRLPKPRRSLARWGSSAMEFTPRICA